MKKVCLIIVFLTSAFIAHSDDYDIARSISPRNGYYINKIYNYISDETTYELRVDIENNNYFVFEYKVNEGNYYMNFYLTEPLSNETVMEIYFNTDIETRFKEIHLTVKMIDGKYYSATNNDWRRVNSDEVKQSTFTESNVRYYKYKIRMPNVNFSVLTYVNNGYILIQNGTRNISLDIPIASHRIIQDFGMVMDMEGSLR